MRVGGGETWRLGVSGILKFWGFWNFCEFCVDKGLRADLGFRIFGVFGIFDNLGFFCGFWVEWGLGGRPGVWEFGKFTEFMIFCGILGI